MKRYYLLLALFVVLFSCKKKSDYVVTDYTYAGTAHAISEQVSVQSSGTNTLAWDSTYLDKVYVHHDIAAGTVTFTISEQQHACKSFQQIFTFNRNNLDIYTANSNTYQASQTFTLTQNSLTASMLRYDGSDSNHTQYTLNFQGVIVQ
ncbi:MAG: hypothetical protein JNM95_01560 [Chitinophagaceae bacterium]|nr:hypothetical protein [Chitinophagaceae bacterium]